MPNPPAPVTPLKLAICTFLSQSRESVLKLIDHNRKIGADHIFLFFDYPEEADFPEIADFDDVTIVACDDTFWNSCPGGRSDVLIKRNEFALLKGYQMATAAGCDFAALIDGDELLYAKGNLIQAIRKHAEAADILRLYPYEAILVCKDKRDEFSQTHFKALPNRINRAFLRWTYGDTLAISDDGFFGHLSGKAIVRTGLTFKHINVHCPTPETPARTVRIKDVWLLHFDCMNFSSWKRKWALRLNGKAIGTMRDKRKRQFTAIEKAFQDDEIALENLYEAFFVLDFWRVTLGRATGLIRKVNLS
ncbi:MAG: glycosyltransferase family 92 protein [Pseudomonadota bacterium]